MLTLSFGIFFRQPLYFGVNCSRRNVHLYFFYSVQKIDAQISTTTTGATRAEGGLPVVLGEQTLTQFSAQLLKCFRGGGGVYFPTLSVYYVDINKDIGKGDHICTT